MNKKIIIAGSGGQGILFLGKILAFASMIERKEVTWFPSYGAEMRGGTATCTVIISDHMIGSPVVLTPDILIIMNNESLGKFQTCLRTKGLLLYDSSLVKAASLRKDIDSVPIPAATAAGTGGNTKSANMVMLGALVAKTGIVKKSSVLKVLESSSGSSANIRPGANTNLFLEGIKYIENSKSKDS